jgi:signal transduction histidine kinase/DNA-binding response OmpR family regulator
MNQQTHPTGEFPVRVLIVDDHPNTATTLARAVSQLGDKVEVFSATSGREALECVKGGAADVLITDMIMPEMNGLELVEKLQNHPAGRPTHTILITAYDVPGLKETARRLKVNEIIVKPVRPERICQIVNQIIEEWSHAKQPANNKKAPRKAFKILIADDHPDNVTLLARYLENEGYDYVTAGDGVEAMEKTRAELPDLVLLDVNMPNKDGFAVLEEIRADPAIQHIPVIILTAARLDPTDIQSGLTLGADDYVTKPFDRRELMARIRTKLRVKEIEDSMRRRNRELMLLPEIGKDLSARLDIQELSTVLLKRTVETLGAALGYILILDPAGSFKKTYRLSDSPSLSTADKDLPLPVHLLEEIHGSLQGLILEETQTDPRWQALFGDQYRSAVVVPLSGRHELLGLLILAHEEVKYFNLEHLLLLQAIASQAAIAVENAQLYASMARERGRLEAVLQSAADAILMFDDSGRLNLLNPAGERLFTDCKARIGFALETGHGYDGFIELLEQARLAQITRSAEILWPDQRALMAIVTPVEEGGYVAVLQDVTHFKDVERVKNEFIASASHDLMNPIAAISGFSHIMAQAGPLNDQQTEFVQHIQSASQNMNELVQNMLELVQIDLEAEPKKEPVDFPELVADVQDEFQPLAKDKGLSLTFEKNSDPLTVPGDRLRLRQMVRNLIGNAVKFTPPGGTISLSIGYHENMAVFRVKDTGPGIPQANLPFIFNRFYRAHSNSTEHVEGNGLGLAIVKSIVNQHDGQVSVESAPASGSCFSVSLPLLSLAELDKDSIVMKC